MMHITMVSNARGLQWRILAGVAAAQAYLTKLAEQVQPAGPLSLVEFQVQAHAQGFKGVQLVESMYGWTVRFESGLDEFGLLASVRQGTLDGSLEAAVACAEAWVTQDAAHRWASISAFELQKVQATPPVEALATV